MKVCVWSDDVSMNRDTPMAELNEHQASVKALAWCPWKSQVLASGGGMSFKLFCESNLNANFNCHTQK